MTRFKRNGSVFDLTDVKTKLDIVLKASKTPAVTRILRLHEGTHVELHVCVFIPGLAYPVFVIGERGKIDFGATPQGPALAVCNIVLAVLGSDWRVEHDQQTGQFYRENHQGKRVVVDYDPPDFHPIASGQ